MGTELLTGATPAPDPRSSSAPDEATFELLADRIRGLAEGRVPRGEAFDVLGEPLHKWITKDIARQFHKHDDDSPREVFMEVMKRIGRSAGTIVAALDAGAVLQAYLWRMATNAAKDRKKKLKRIAHFSQQLSERNWRELSSQLNTPQLMDVEEGLIRDERLRPVLRALRSMTPEEEAMLALSSEGERPKTIAAILGLPVAEVRKQLKSAWRRFKAAARREGAK